MTGYSARCEVKTEKSLVSGSMTSMLTSAQSRSLSLGTESNIHCSSISSSENDGRTHWNSVLLSHSGMIYRRTAATTTSAALAVVVVTIETRETVAFTD